ncbi:Mth938-like domain-containing protein [Alphaproteobacteria bacterium]|nr:Mth938-like domain-containing protein [Alphaproteobacteria bacterium]
MKVEVKDLKAASDLQLIHGYGEGGFRVTGNRYKGDLLLLTRSAHEWNHPNIDDLRFSDLVPLLGETPPPLFLLGVGGAPMHQFSALSNDLKAHGINLELMSTPSACRTWNVLMSEGRDAAVGLIAI